LKNKDFPVAGQGPRIDVQGGNKPDKLDFSGSIGGLPIYAVVSFKAILRKDETFIDDPIYRRVPFEKSPEALFERSRLFLQKTGLSGQFKESAWGFMINADLLNYIEASDKTGNRWKKLDARAILFWYRQSPQPLGLLELAA
jgi:hypothetical protein